jgi:UDP-GlcNAc:undecaprenyl-phosphate GlcNAc-1-phosphate transferase
VALISSLAIALTAMLSNQYQLAGCALALAGGAAGFLIYNSKPASIFMGDSGALMLGALLGVLSFKIAATTSGGWPVKGAVLGFLMALPLLDTSIVTVTRLATGIPISRGGRDHSSHRLVNLGLSDRAAAHVLYLVEALGVSWAIAITLLPGYIALALTPLGLLFFALLGLFFMNLSFDGDSAPGQLYVSVPRVARAILDLGYRRRAVEFGLDLLVIASAFYGSYLLDRNFDVSRLEILNLTAMLPLAATSTYCAFLLTGVYRGIWRYTGVEDALRFAFAALLSGAFVTLVFRNFGHPFSASHGVIFVLLVFMFLLATRMSFRVFLMILGGLALSRWKVLIVGAGDRADTAARLLREQMVGVVGFVDDDTFKHNKLVRGSWVIGGISELANIYSSRRFQEILMADDRISVEGAAMVKAFADTHGIAVQEFHWTSAGVQ